MWWPALGGLVVGLGGLSSRARWASAMTYRRSADRACDRRGRRAHAARQVASGRGAGLGNLGRRAGAAARILGGVLGWLEGQFLPGGALGVARHGGDDGRDDAIAADGVLFAIELTGDVTL